MNNDEFFKLILPIGITLFDIKTIKKIYYRELSVLEYVILSLAEYFKKISPFEIIFSTGIKVTMKPLIQEIVNELYNNEYLELLTDFDKIRLENNLNDIFNTLYNFKEIYPVISENFEKSNEKTDKQNRLFSVEAIKEEMDKILKDTLFIYQYSITDTGIKAIKTNRVQSYKDDGSSSLLLININSQKINIDFINILISGNEPSYLGNLRATEKSLYPIIERILSQPNDLLKLKNTDYKFIGFNPYTEIEESQTIDGELMLIYDSNLRLTNLNIKSGILYKILLNILLDNLDFFQKKNLFGDNLWNHLQNQILSYDSNITIPLNNLQLRETFALLIMNNIQELDYCKKHLLEPYYFSCTNPDYFYYYEDNEFKFKIAFPLKIIPNPSNKEVFSRYIADYIYKNYIEKKKVICNSELSKIFIDLDAQFAFLNMDYEKALQYYKNDINKMLFDRNYYKFINLDSIVDNYLKKNNPFLSENNNIKYLLDNKNNFNAVITLNSEFSINSLYTHCPKKEETFVYESDEPKKTNIQFHIRILPSNNKNSQILLSNFLLAQNFGLNPTIMFEELKNFLNLTITNWKLDSRFICENFIDCITNEIESLSPKKHTNIYGELHENKQSKLTILEIEAYKIKSEIEESINLNFGEPLNYDKKNKYFELIYLINQEQTLSYLNKINNEFIIKFVRSKLPLVEHLKEFNKKINDYLTLSYKIYRIIKFEDIITEEDEKNVYNLLIRLFQYNISKDQTLYDINTMYNKFQNYSEDYKTNLVRLNYEQYIPYYEKIDLKLNFIEEFHKNGYFFLEDKIIRELEKIFGYYKIPLNFNHIRISDVNTENVWYELTPQNYQSFVKSNVELYAPFSLQFEDTTISKKYVIYFLPSMKDINVFNEDFFIDYITKLLISNLKSKELGKFLSSNTLNEEIKIVFEDLKGRYEFVKGEHHITNKKITDFVTKLSNNKKLLKEIEIIDPILFQELRKVKIIKKYDLIKQNNILINNSRKIIEIKITKNQLSRFEEEEELIFLTQLHKINFNIKSQKLSFEYLFTPSDIHSLYPIEIFSNYYLNNTNFNFEDFKRLSFEEFKNYLMNKYKNSNYSNQIYKDFQKRGTFQTTLKFCLDIFNKIKLKKKKKSN